MIRPTLLSLTLLIAALPATGAWAASEEGGDKPKTEAPGAGPTAKGAAEDKGSQGRDLERMDQFSTYLDSKADDKDSAGKWAALEKRLKEKRPDEFTKLDTDGDGHLGRAEITIALEQAQAAFKDKHAELFAAIDTDHDGKLTVAEIHAARDAAREKHRGEGHAKGDAPKDGGEPAPAK